MDLRRSVFPILAGILALSGCSQSPQARGASYLAKGKKEVQKKDYEVAIIYFKNAMQAQPRDAEPYYQLGLAYMASSDIASGASYLRKATELNPGHAGAQLTLAGLMAASRNKELLQEAEKRTRSVLNRLPDDAEALDVLALAELRLGKPESAEAHLEQALKKSPGHLRSSVALAQTRLARRDLAGAEEALKQAVAQAPKSPDALVYLGGFYLASGKNADAEQQFRRALEIGPKNGAALMALGAMQVRAGQTDQAEQTYRRVSALPEKHYRPVHALYLFQSGKRDQAVVEFEKLAKEDPADREARTRLVQAYLSVKRVAEAERVLTAVLKKNPLDADALLQRSRIYLGSTKYTEAQADLENVLRFRGDSAEAHYLLSRVRQGQGEAAGRQQELGEALRLDPSLAAARLELAQVLIANRGAQSGLQLLDEAPQDQRNAAPVLVQRNWALLALGQKAEARKAIDQILASARVPDAVLQDAVLKLDQKDYAGARASVEEVLKQNPEDTRALNVLVATYAAQKQLPAGLEKARGYAVRQPRSAALQQFLGQLLAENGDRVGAQKAFEAAKAADPALIAPDLSLADLESSEGKREDARKRLSALVASHPGSVAGRLMWAQLEATDGRSTAAIEQYRKALELDSRNVAALNNLAYLLADGNQPDEALKYAQAAKEIAPDSPAVDDTLGWVYFRKGLYSLAVTHLESAIAKDGTARRKYHLAMACMKAGDPKRGRQVLEAALKMDPRLPEADEARRLLANGAK